MCYRFI